MKPTSQATAQGASYATTASTPKEETKKKGVSGSAVDEARVLIERQNRDYFLESVFEFRLCKLPIIRKNPSRKINFTTMEGLTYWEKIAVTKCQEEVRQLRLDNKGSDTKND